MSAIVVEELTKKYGSFTAVEKLSFRVGKGEVFGLLGANGSGKGTSIECILGTKTADSGTVSILPVVIMVAVTVVCTGIAVRFFKWE